MITPRLRNSLAKLTVAGFLLLCPVVLTAATASPGWAVSTFASGFSNSGPYGPTGIAADKSGNLYVQDYSDGKLFKFGPQGGAASAPTLIGTNPAFSIFALTFSKDGRLYATDQFNGSIVELNSGNAQIARTVVSGKTGFGIATDPLSGDLFFGGNDGTIYRISNFGSGPGTVSAYVRFQADAVSFGPDGTLYATGSISVGGSGAIVKIGGTNTSQPAPTTIALVPSADGVAASADGTFVAVNRNDGTITKIDVTSLAQSQIVSGGSRGDFVAVGTDGCLYATQTNSVLKVTAADGTCPFASGQPVTTSCSLVGSWAFSMQGFSLSPSAVARAASGRFTASLGTNAAGKPKGVLVILQTAAIDGTVTRLETNAGTFEVNSDCLGGNITFNLAGRPLQFDFFFVSANEIVLVGANNGEVVTFDATRVSAAVGCPADLAGAWVFATQGFAANTAVSLAAAGRFVGAAGSLQITQTSSNTGSISRLESSGGRYQINGDCLGGTLTFNLGSRPIQFDFFFVNPESIVFAGSNNGDIVTGAAWVFGSTITK